MFPVSGFIWIYDGVHAMDNMADSGERDRIPLYDPSMGIIGWVVVALVIWSVVLVSCLMLS